MSGGAALLVARGGQSASDALKGLGLDDGPAPAQMETGRSCALPPAVHSVSTDSLVLVALSYVLGFLCRPGWPERDRDGECGWIGSEERRSSRSVSSWPVVSMQRRVLYLADLRAFYWCHLHPFQAFMTMPWMMDLSRLEMRSDGSRRRTSEVGSDPFSSPTSADRADC